VTLAPEHHDRVLIVNGTPHVRLVIDSVTPAVWAAKVFDSRGRVVRERATSLDAGLQAFEIPVAGVAVLDRRD
jgi:hypothetical protein